MTALASWEGAGHCHHRQFKGELAGESLLGPLCALVLPAQACSENMKELEVLALGRHLSRWCPLKFSRKSPCIG